MFIYHQFISKITHDATSMGNKLKRKITIAYLSKKCTTLDSHFYNLALGH